jgi:hypothetical protein
MSAQTAKCQICVGVAVRRDGSIDMRQALSDFAERVRDFAEGIPGGSVVNDCDLAAATARAERAEELLQEVSDEAGSPILPHDAIVAKVQAFLRDPEADR